MGKFIDLTGQRFGLWTVISRESTVRGHAMWRCRCKCGNEKVVSSYNLRSGMSKSCGCTRKESLDRYYSGRFPAHGLYSTAVYKIYKNMIYRTENPNSKDYKNYGERGIKVCREWRNNFKAFYDWSMSSGYEKSLTIDRIDVNKGYSPDNCRWVSRKIQANNTRVNHTIEFSGKRHTLAEWGDITGIPRLVILKRLKRGWPVDRALTEPVRKTNRA